MKCYTKYVRSNENRGTSLMHTRAENSRSTVLFRCPDREG